MQGVELQTVNEYGRPLGTIEHVFWALAFHHSNQFAVAAEIEGATTLADWQMAFAAATRRHPLLSAAIRYRRDSGPWFVGPIAALPSIRLGTGSWQQEAALEIRKPFDFANGPLVRCVLIPSPHGSTVVLSAFHAVADGLALVYLLRDLLRAIAEENLPAPRPSRSLDHFLAEDMERVRAAGVTPPADPPPDLAVRRNSGEPSQVDSIALPVQDTARIRALARAQQTTVHAALITAVTEAMRDLSRERSDLPLRLITPIDLRRRVREIGDELAPYVAGAAMTLAPPSGDRWDETRQIGRSVEATCSRAAATAWYTGLADMVASSPSIEVMTQDLVKAFAYHFLITNMGPLDIPETYGRLRLKAVWGPSVAVGFEGEQVIGASCFGGALRLVHTSYEPIDGLLDQVRVRLGDFLQS